MLTIDDVAAVPLFSALPQADLERLARTSADLHLGAGEFAVHEGGERALFAVLSGKIEVVKTFDGIERTLGWRVPGAIFGEVPIALGTPFPGRLSRRRTVARDARRGSAILRHRGRIEGQSSQKVGALARERIGGLQSIAAEPPKPRVTIGRSPLGYRVRRLAPVPGAQPDFFQLADARCAGTRRRLWPGDASAGRRRSRGAARGRSGDRSARRCAISPIASACRPAPRVGRIRCRDHRRRAGRPRGGGLRRIRRAAHDRRRARGARRTGRDVVADRELSRLSERRLRRRACQPRAAAGKAARGGDPGHALGRPHRSGDARSFPRRRRRRPGANHHSGHRRHVAAPRDRRLRSAHRQGRLLWRRAQRGRRHAWARRLSSSAPETRPARRRCTSPIMRAG